MTSYLQAYARAADDPEGFWREQAAALDWHRFPQQIFTAQADGSGRWFADGQLNTCHLAVDRHVADGAGERCAILYDSPATGVQERISYQQLQARVARCAGMLRALGWGVVTE